jgi:hypothetical protein
MVCRRARPDDRIGLMIETLFSLSGKSREALVIRHRAAPKGDKSALAKATLIFVNYCPFCGKKLRDAR